MGGAKLEKYARPGGVGGFGVALMPEGNAVKAMFAEVAPRYDVANHLLSGGVDFYWRRKLTGLVRAHQPQTVVDLATGSGDVAFALRRALPQSTDITGMDFCEPMLDSARAKQEKAGAALTFEVGDCMTLPLEDNSVDAVTIAFGVRNFEDRDRGLREMRRVLRPGGAAFVLEFSQPFGWFRPIYYVYLKGLLPLFARWICGRRDAYDYLAGSIEEFPAAPDFCREFEQAGFSKVNAFRLTLGIVAIHRAVK